MPVVVTALVKVQPAAREEALAALTRGIEATHGEDGNLT
jgi:quinol monooxygenase YgiN